ncbi:MAG: response regulator transcription factor [Eggerthellaceae bacterium]
MKPSSLNTDHPHAAASRNEQHRSTRILVVDDDQAIADLLRTLLEAEGMHVTTCLSGYAALDALDAEQFDLGILDIMMPGMDGFELCRRIRARSEMPLLFLSAKDEETDKVIGFTLGADDYISKPFKSRELIARIRARLRRANTPPAQTDSTLRMRGITLDAHSHEVSLHDQPLHLTPKEFALLHRLLKAQGNPVSAEELYEQIWQSPYDASAANTVMVHIRHLRKKLAAIDSSEQFIETAWGIGYQIKQGSQSL